MQPALSTVDMLYAVGHWLLDEQRPLDAIHVFRTMMITAPQDERSWLGLGTSHERVGQLDIAIELYQLGETTVTISFRCSLARARLLRRIDAQHDEAYERAEDRARLVDDDAANAIALERAQS
jgi:hypothetical protein